MRVRNSFASIPSNGSWRRKHSYKCLTITKIKILYIILYELPLYKHDTKFMIARTKFSRLYVHRHRGSKDEQCT